MNPRNELVTWEEVTRLVESLLGQFDQQFTVMVMITRGGIVPGGMLAEAMDIQSIYTASVDFPAELESNRQPQSRFLAWPKFLQFPDSSNLEGQTVLVVDDVWGSGRTITAVRNRVVNSGGQPCTCVLHFNPFRNLFGKNLPDYYGATTDAFIIYPWETNPGFQKGMLGRIH